MSRQIPLRTLCVGKPFPEALTQVLLLGHDPQLLSYRNQVLQTTGLLTRAVRWEAGMLATALPPAIVVILCHTLGGFERWSIVDGLRRMPHPPRLIGLDAGFMQPEERSGFDVVVENLSGPQALIACVQSQLAWQQPSKT